MRDSLTTLSHHFLTIVDYTPFQIVHSAVQHFAFWAELGHDVLRLEITVCPPFCMQALDTLQHVAIEVTFTVRVDSFVCLSVIFIMSIDGIFH